MQPNIIPQVIALIEHIQTRYHEGHRRAIPELLVLAAAAEACGIDDTLVDELAAFGDALERHLFKEEMRLFPMMEQGGNTLIPQLIEDLHREHVQHDVAMGALLARCRALSASHPLVPTLEQLARGVEDLAVELARHIHAEDEELFPLFSRPQAPASTLAHHP
jgi:regulator of cell morphogenesis and NO signaling